MIATAQTSRIVGIDVARALAVIGMFGAHVGVVRVFDFADPGSWAGIVNGRSSILFAVLAGVSLSILSGGRSPLDGDELGWARARILIRGMLVFVLGIGLELLDTNVAVILAYYGIAFVLALPFLRLRPAVLFAAAAAIALLAPFALNAATDVWGFPADAGLLSIPVNYLFTGYYPVALWMAFVLAGLAIGRLDLMSTRIRLTLLATGAALATAGYGIGALIAPLAGGSRLASLEPHSGSAFEAVGSGGFAIAVLALCLFAGDAAPRLLFPLAAVGSMALTVYATQIVVIDVLDLPVPGTTDDVNWLWLTVGALVVCTVWVLLLGRGPLERALTWTTKTMTGAARTPAGSPSPRP